MATLLVALGLVALVASQAGAASSQGNPPGNNGTIKIDGVSLQAGPRHEPHVGCEFAVEFFGYEEGDLSASLSFELQAPTRRASGSQVIATDRLRIGEDPAGGATDLDASRKYNLEFIGVAPHDQQGYHVKLTIHAEGSQGADVKHKVFWVQPCAAPPPPTTTTTTTTTTVTTAPPTTVTTVRPTTATTVAPTTAATAPPTTAITVAPVVQGEVVQRPAVTAAPSVAQPQALARTGADMNRLAALGAGLVLTGLVLLGRGRRLQLS